MHLAETVFVIGLVLSCVLILLSLYAISTYWRKHATQYATERVEKACDAVTSLVALLIPATLAVTTWVVEKTGTTWYGTLLALSTIWFLFVLVFTMYVRFNLVWGLPEKVPVGKGENMGIIQWLTSVMVGLTVGLIFLAIPTFSIVFRTHPTAEISDSGSHYEYQVYETHTCYQPCPVVQPANRKMQEVPEASQKRRKEE